MTGERAELERERSRLASRFEQLTALHSGLERELDLAHAGAGRLRDERDAAHQAAARLEQARPDHSRLQNELETVRASLAEAEARYATVLGERDEPERPSRRAESGPAPARAGAGPRFKHDPNAEKSNSVPSSKRS